MPATPIRRQRGRGRNGRLPNHVVLDKVRDELAKADRAGTRRPGRPALIRLTGGTGYQVRLALARLKTQWVADIPAVSPTTPPISGPYSTFRQNGAHMDTSTPPTSSADTPSPDKDTHGDTPGDTVDDLVDDTNRDTMGEIADDMAGDTASPDRAGESNTDIPVRTPRAWPLALIGVAAAVAVWGGWVDLGRLTGFGMVQPLPGLLDGFWINTAIVLPIGIEAYGGYALRTWLSAAALSIRTRRYARRSALASLAVGAGAQVASHLMKAYGITIAPWWVTVVVSCVPVVVLGLATGLATFVRQDTLSISTSTSAASVRQPAIDTAPAPGADDCRGIRRAEDMRTW